MIKLTTEHIEEIRRYFLADVEEDQLLILNSIQPSYISSFLPQLKKIFTGQENADTNLISFVKSISAEDQLEALKEIQKDYYTHLAIKYNSGVSNPDIETLVKTNNTHFINEANFQKELKRAFHLNERADVKRKFQELDNESDISPEEITLAFKLEERKQLKEIFKIIENATVLKQASPVIQFNWKRLAIAATLIGAMLTTIFYVFDKKTNQTDLASVSNIEKQHIADSITNRNSKTKRLTDLLANKALPFEEENKLVLKKASLGFAANEEKITIRTYLLQSEISKIDDEISGDTLNKDRSETTIRSLKLKRDSLMNLENKYNFNNAILTLYLSSKKNVKVFKIDTSYYLKVNNIFYECKMPSKLLPLIPTGISTSNKIEELIF